VVRITQHEKKLYEGIDSAGRKGEFKEEWNCIELIPVDVKFLAYKVTSEVMGVINQDSYTSFQIHLRRLHDFRYKVYR
jgi:hypothetical protein